MKKFLVLFLLAALFASFWFFTQNANASPNARITLTEGKTAVVLANNCKLKVVKDTPALVKVKCVPLSGADRGAAAERVAAKVTLSAGQRVKILANSCSLAVTVKKPAKVKVVCNPSGTIVEVGPNGSFAYSSNDVTVHQNETVKWVWKGNNHTVTSGDGTADNLFCSPSNTNCGVASPSNTGATYSHTFDTVGTFKYFCGIHGSFMSGVVRVIP